MECVHAWAAEDGIELEPWGLEISRELAELARRRLPQWRDRIAVGNALDWSRRDASLRAHESRLRSAAAPDRTSSATCWTMSSHADGRLIVGVFNEEQDARIEDGGELVGIRIAGRAERAHPDTPELVRRAFWIDASQR